MTYAISLEFLNNGAIASYSRTFSGIEANNINHAKIQANKLGIRGEDRHCKYLGINYIVCQSGSCLNGNSFYDHSIKIKNPNRPKFVNFEVR